jgi:hypothetical protein
MLCAAVLLLAGCSGPRLPFEKEAPVDAVRADLVRPPWEAYVKAGPGAEHELDLETLDGPNGPLAPPPQSLAEAEQPQAPEAAVDVPVRKPSSPKADAVAIRAVAVPEVKGAGGGELAVAMRQVLKDAGWPVKKAPAKDALTIRGTVDVAAPRSGAQLVSLRWVVSTPDGKVLGDISQQNQVPQGSLAGGWGENARFAAEAAAEGIFKLIQTYR